MQMKCLVFQEVHETWPGRNGKPAGEKFAVLVLDMSEPAEHRLRDMYSYSLTPEEKQKHWGKLAGKTVTMAVNEIRPGVNGGKPYFRGQLINT